MYDNMTILITAFIEPLTQLPTVVFKISLVSKLNYGTYFFISTFNVL